MAYKSTSTVVEQTSPTTPFNVPVQTGVVAGDYCYVVIAGSTNAGNEATITVTPSKAGVTFVLYSSCGATADNNQWWYIYEATGLVAGDNVSVVASANRATSVWIVALDTRLDATGSIYKRGGSSLTTTVAPSIACLASQRIFSFGIERNTTGGTTISSQTNSNGRTVTAEFYAKGSATGGQISLSVSSFIETGTTTGTLTRTYTVASGNAAAMLAQEMDPPASKPSGVGYVGIGTGTDSSTAALSLPMPGGVAPGPGLMIIALVAFWDPARALPTCTTPGFVACGDTLSTDGGGGSYGLDAGPRDIAAWWKVSDGTETSVDFALADGDVGAGARGYVETFSRQRATWTTPLAVAGSDNISGTAMSVTGATDFGGAGSSAGDMLAVGVANIPDTATQGSPAVAYGGGTYTQRGSGAATAGHDARHNVGSHPVAANSSGAPVFTTTLSVAGTGSALFVRLHDETPVGRERRTWLCNLAPDGTQLTPTNVLSEDGAPALTTSGGAGGVLTSSSAFSHTGGYSYLCDPGAGASQAIRLPFANVALVQRMVFYHRAESSLNVNTQIVSLRHAGGVAARIQVHTNGTVSMLNAGGSTVASTASGAWAAGRWNRISFGLAVDTTVTGSFFLNVYDGDGTTPTGTCAASTADFGTAPIVSTDLGSPGTGTITTDHYFDTIVTEDGAGPELNYPVVVYGVPAL